MADRQLPWQRLERSYHADDDLVLARREFGLAAEVFFTRLLAHGKPVRAPQDQEGEVLAAVLGFDPTDAPLIGLIVDWFVANGTISKHRSPGRIAGGKARITRFDLANRAKFRPPDRFLTRSERTSIPAKAEVDGIPGRDAPSRAPSRGASHTNERTDVRTNEHTSEATASRGSRKPDELFDALARAVGWDPGGLTKPERGKLNAAVKALRDVDATPADVVERANTYRKRHPEWTLTPNALASHWSDLVGAHAGPSMDAKRAELLEHVAVMFGDQAEAIVTKATARAPIEGNRLDDLLKLARRIGTRELGLVPRESGEEEWGGSDAS